MVYFDSCLLRAEQIGDHLGSPFTAQWVFIERVNEENQSLYVNMGSSEIKTKMSALSPSLEIHVSMPTCLGS